MNANKVVTGVICDYCGEEARLVTGKTIYPHRPDLFGKKLWFCDRGHEPAYVGCHGGGSKPLGRLADSELRQWKIEAHAAFDPIWKYRIKKTRRGAYQWLAHKMGIPEKDCHIGMFSVEQCKQAIAICKEVIS